MNAAFRSTLTSVPRFFRTYGVKRDLTPSLPLTKKERDRVRFGQADAKSDDRLNFLTNIAFFFVRVSLYL